MNLPIKHLKVRVDSELAEAVERAAKRRATSVSDAVRTILAEQIRDEESPTATPASLQAAVFTTLIVSELAVRLIASFLPEGEDAVVRNLNPAAEEARKHLERVELSMKEAEAGWLR